MTQQLIQIQFYNLDVPGENIGYIVELPTIPAKDSFLDLNGWWYRVGHADWVIRTDGYGSTVSVKIGLYPLTVRP